MGVGVGSVDDLESLHAIALEAVRNAGFDPRLVFVRVRTTADGALVCESNDAAVLARVLPRVSAAAPRSVTSVSLPEARLNDLTAWVTASVAEVRRTPSHTAKQVTQALQGEALRPLVHEDGWLACVLPDGYVGWVRDWHVQLQSAPIPAHFAAACDARITVPWVQLRDQAHMNAAVTGESIHGTHVRRRGHTDAWTEIELPGGRFGWVPSVALRAGRDDWPHAIDALLTTLLGYRGVPYLWGGKSPKGFDCSGLVQFAFGLHGTALPRDADQQALAGVAIESPAAGDLLYFGRDRVTHVAVMLDDARFVHARGETRLNTLDAGAPDYDPELHALLLGARRVWAPIA